MRISDWSSDVCSSDLEPLAALDAARKEEILPYLERLRAQLRLPVVYVSHALPEVLRLADHLVLLENGAVRAAGPLADLAATPGLLPADAEGHAAGAEIGRASCRESACQYG